MNGKANGKFFLTLSLTNLLFFGLQLLTNLYKCQLSLTAMVKNIFSNSMKMPQYFKYEFYDSNYYSLNDNKIKRLLDVMKKNYVS